MTGWITNTKEFVECSVYHHITISLLRDPRFAACAKIAKALEELDEVEESCQALHDCEGPAHAEWHCYEMAQDDVLCTAKKILLNNGFIRVGSTSDEIHFEGRPNILKKRHQFLVDFADGYGASAIFCPIR